MKIADLPFGSNTAILSYKTAVGFHNVFAKRQFLPFNVLSLSSRMRVPSCIYSAKHKARAPQRESAVPFQEILPLRLKNSVSGKSDSGSDVACLQEMGLLFACLKDNEFAEKFCSKEITQFQKCYKVYMDRNAAVKATVNQGIITPGNNLNYRQLNKYMRRFPNPE